MVHDPLSVDPECHADIRCGGDHYIFRFDFLVFHVDESEKVESASVVRIFGKVENQPVEMNGFPAGIPAFFEDGFFVIEESDIIVIGFAHFASVDAYNKPYVVFDVWFRDLECLSECIIEFHRYISCIF